ncbi:MAG TPA: hypothetical protein VGG28_33390 [Kofleriaceae bacterium]|jgi:hypothetical protein
MKLVIVSLLISSTALATPTPPTPPGPPPGPPRSSCTTEPGTQLVAIDQTSTGVIAEHSRIVVRTNGAWEYDVADAHGNFLMHGAGCLDASKLAALHATTWMSDLSALAAQLEDPGPIARSPGKPVR